MRQLRRGVPGGPRRPRAATFQVLSVECMVSLAAAGSQRQL
ncbi:MAG: hypothetical protein ABSB32_15665 [Thermodesulfobacteriota bacterium]